MVGKQVRNEMLTSVSKESTTILGRKQSISGLQMTASKKYHRINMVNE